MQISAFERPQFLIGLSQLTEAGVSVLSLLLKHLFELVEFLYVFPEPFLLDFKNHPLFSDLLLLRNEFFLLVQSFELFRHLVFLGNDLPPLLSKFALLLIEELLLVHELVKL